MLALTGKVGGEGIVIDGSTVVRVTEVRGNAVRFAIDAPKHVSINRQSIEAKLKQLGRRFTEPGH